MPALAFAALLLCAPALAQREAPESLLRNPTEACRKLGLDLRQRVPSLRQRPAHWFIGVDISGSMREGELDTAKNVLRDHLTYLVTPGDRITLLAFDDELRTFGPWDAGADRGPLLPRVLDPLSVRPNRRGSDLHGARSRLLELAAAATASDKTRVPVSILITDRDDPDALPRADGFTQGLEERVGARMGSREGKGSGEVESEAQWGMRQPGGAHDVYLVAITSVSREAASVPARLLARRVPLAEPQVNRHDPEDPMAGLRTFLRLLPWVVLLALVGLCVWMWTGAKGGALVGGDFARLILPWRPFPRTTRNVPASRYTTGFRLEPERPGFEGTVLQAGIENPWSWSRWRASLTAVPPYQVQKDGEGWRDQVFLEPEREATLVVKDQAGHVASGRARFSPDSTLRHYRWALLLSGVFVVSLIAGPVVNSALGPPPEPTTTTVTAEPF